MLTWLNKLLSALYCALTARPAPTRVGLLDSGELVLVDGFGHAQVLGAQTTDVIRDVLAAGESQTVHLLGIDPAAPGSDSTVIARVLRSSQGTSVDDVHRILAEARQ